MSRGHWFLTTYLGQILKAVLGWTINRKECVVVSSRVQSIPVVIHSRSLHLGADWQF